MKGITLKSNFIDQFSLRQWDHAIEQQFLSKQILIQLTQVTDNEIGYWVTSSELATTLPGDIKTFDQKNQVFTCLTFIEKCARKFYTQAQTDKDTLTVGSGRYLS